MSKIWLIPLLFTILFTSSFGNAFAAVDYFLKIDGVEGESTDDKHKGQIEIESWSWGATQTGTSSTGGGGGAGKVQFQDFHFTKKVDKSSPKLMQAVATGEHLKSVELTVRKAGGTQMDYYIVHLEDVLVSSYSSSGSSGEVPMESISFNYQKIEFQYIPTNPDGTAGQAVKASWNLATATR
ncbi:MAG TPA: type VI secretion system tube protein Hcp [Nitrosopumilaceae archaeon]|nr:type VI secretion system tube protein Hcp [Nitrosopumilaceae archaeon]